MKKTIIALLVLITLGAYYWFVELKKKGEDQIKRTESTRVFTGLKADDVKSITLESALSKTVLEKSNNEFMIVSPERSYSEKYTVQSIVKEFAEVKNNGTIENADIAQFGLGVPKHKVTLSDASGRSYCLLLGDLNPAGTYAYAMTPGAKDAVMVNANILSLAGKNFNDLRFKGLLRSEEDKITRVRSTIKGKEFFAEKENGKWSLKSHSDAAMKWDNLKMALSAIKNASAKKFLKTGADYGFKKDADYIYIEQEGKPEMLFFGRHNKKDLSVFVKNGNFGYVIEAPDYIFTNAPSPVNFINKQPLVFEAADVYGIKVWDKNASFEGKRGKKDKWSLASKKNIKDAKQINFAQLVSALYGLESKAKHAKGEGVAVGGFFGQGMNNISVKLYDLKRAEIGTLTFAEKASGDIVYIRNEATQDIYETDRNYMQNFNIPGMEVPE